MKSRWMPATKRLVAVAVSRLVRPLLSIRRNLFGCPSRFDVMPKNFAASGEHLPTRRLDKRTANKGKNFIVFSSCGDECRDSCPRFQAMWKRLAIEEECSRVGNLLVSGRCGKSDLRNCDREVSKVDDFQADAGVVCCEAAIPLRSHTDLDSVSGYGAPYIDDAKNGTEKRQPECDGILSGFRDDLHEEHIHFLPNAEVSRGDGSASLNPNQTS